ncbi:MAG: VWA domain-containing protein, partial [Clostridia bacterium]|nr:VWA domain-containing protein [Clostridia bacterium]
MKKSVLAILLCVLMASLTFVPAFAAEIASVDTSALPEISVEVDGAGDVKADSIKATLDGQELDVSGVKAAKASSTEWIIMVDTSASNNKQEFASEKAGIKALINSLGENEKVVLYTFDEKVEKVLDGSESKEAAVKKVDAINCDGQHTAFYAAASKAVDLAKASKADNVVPVIYSDGEDTSKDPKITATKKKVAASKAAIKGFYPSGTKAEHLKTFKALVESSGGSVAAFTPKGSGTQLKKANPQADQPAGKTTIKLTANENIDANDAAVLSIDLGDGKPITKETKVAAWSPEPATEVETTEVATTEAPTTEAPATTQEQTSQAETT